MALPLIVSLPRRVQGLETLAHFVILEGNTIGGNRCLGPNCGTYLWDRLSPVELADGGEIDQDATGDCSPLCRICSFRLSARIVAGWPSEMTTSEVSSLWKLANAEQARDLERELARDRASALDDLQAANAALEQARPNQGINDSRKVA